MNPTKRTIVTLCGSTRFHLEFQTARFDLTMAGHVVLTIGCDAEQRHGSYFTDEQKHGLDLLHFDKIAMSDEVLVLNVGGYVGESTRNEIAYAMLYGKRVRWLEGDGQSWLADNAQDIEQRVAVHVDAGRGPKDALGWDLPMPKQWRKQWNAHRVPAPVGWSNNDEGQQP